MRTKKRLTGVIVLALIYLFVGTCYAEMSEEMAKTEPERIVSQYKGIFTSPPERVPTILTVDGPILGNGDVGVVIGGEPEAQRFWLSKNDFWKAKALYPNGMPCVIGWIDIKLPQFDGASYRVEQNIFEGETLSVFKKGDVTMKIRTWVAATENLLVIELVGGEGWLGEERFMELNVEVSLTPKSGHDSEITCTNQGRLCGDPQIRWRGFRLAGRGGGCNAPTAARRKETALTDNGLDLRPV